MCWAALLCQAQIVKLGLGEVFGPVVSAYTCSPAGTEDGGGAGQLPTLRANRSVPASRYGLGQSSCCPWRPGVELCPWSFSAPWLVRPRGGVAIDHEQAGPQAGLGLPHLYELVPGQGQV